MIRSGKEGKTERRKGKIGEKEAASRGVG